MMVSQIYINKMNNLLNYYIYTIQSASANPNFSN